MIHDTIDEQEPAWPTPKTDQMLALLQQSCHDLAPRKKRGGRPPTLQWQHLIWAILQCFWRGWHAQLDVWRLVTHEQIGPFAPVQVCDQAVYNRIAQAEVWMSWAFESISGWLRKRLEPWEDRCLCPWASAVYAVDASTLEKIGRYVPWLRTVAQSSDDLLGGQISALFNVRLQQWERVQWWPNARDNCKLHFLTLVEQVQAGALLLFDRGYFSFPLFDTLSKRGIWWISRMRHPVTSQIKHLCYQGDGVLDAIVLLGTNRDNQAQYAVRLLQFWWQGRQYEYLTNVLDPHQLSLANVASLYARRWDIELAFRAIKEFVNLHHLWSSKPAVIQVQLWCCLIQAQVYHALQVEIAREAGVEVFDVSVALLIRLTPGWLAQGLCPLEHAVRFGQELKLIRPSTRLRVQVPWIDPSWVDPPPPEAIQPRTHYRYCGEGKVHDEGGASKTKRASPKKEPQKRREGKPKNQPAVATTEAEAQPILLGPATQVSNGPLVRLKRGKLYLSE